MRLKSKIIPIGIALFILPFVMIYKVNGHNALNISTIKGNLSDMKGIYLEARNTNSKNYTKKYIISNKGISLKKEISKYSLENDTLKLIENNTSSKDNTSYIAISEDRNFYGESKNIESNIKLFKAKNKKDLVKSTISLDGDNTVYSDDIDYTKFDIVEIPLNINSTKENIDSKLISQVSLEYAFRRGNDIFAVISYEYSNNKTQIDVLKIDPNKNTVSKESEYIVNKYILLSNTFKYKNDSILFVGKNGEDSKNLITIKYNFKDKRYIENKINLGYNFEIFYSYLDKNILSLITIDNSEVYSINILDIDLNTGKIVKKKYLEKDLNVLEDSLLSCKIYNLKTDKIAYIYSSKNDNKILKIVDKNTGKVDSEYSIKNLDKGNFDFILKGEEFNE
ncbi:hypothetical protein [Peptacetobacter sp.]|uniref:hypothetical protein n=1 Tax=Peptacetobacter sp. TaxID=2991975 RepID=UPI00260AFA03|nr:hypothetical protein [Peptacetobacter sp.]